MIRTWLVAILVLALAGCSHPNSPAQPGTAVTVSYTGENGAAWFPMRNPAGNFSIFSNGEVSFPFALQATWFPQNGAPEPLIYGFEMDFRHQLIGSPAAVNIANQSVQAPPVADLAPSRAGATRTFNGQTEGYLMFAWANVPTGVSILFNGSEPSNPIVSTSTMYSERSPGITSVYSPGLIAASGQFNINLETPTQFVNLRLLEPSNVEAGQVSMNGDEFDWMESLSGATNSSCIDCFQANRFAGIAPAPSTFAMNFVGRAGSLQLYLVATSIPESIAAGMGTGSLERFPDCATAFNGCN